jgi:hypothetical protein
MTIYPKNYYVYMYLREDGTPYYIGKGKHRRAWVNTGRTINRPQDESRIEIHTDNLTEDEALSLEIELIAEYGRKDNGTGILRNLTDGGDGVSGLRHNEETKRKISEAGTNRQHTEETRRKMSKSHKGKVMSQDARRKMSEFHRGKTLSESHREKIGDANKKRPCRDGSGVEYESIKEAADAHGIKYQTARARCGRNTRGWSYI